MDDIIRMSNSSFNQISTCEMQYSHRKIFKGEVDSDADTNQKHFRIGSCFHEILEHCLHIMPNSTPDAIYASFEQHSIDDPKDRGLIIAMCNKYYALHAKSNLTVIGCEDEVGDERTLGYIDAIMKDPDGYWYIVDLKTAKRFNTNLLARLKRDSQLNLYAYFRKQIADKYGLSMEQFDGVLYRVTEKVERVMRADEDEWEYAERIEPKVNSYSIHIPADELDPIGAYQAVIAAQERAMEIRDKGAEPRQNFGACFNYFRPCDYFSKCYGYLNSEAHEHFRVLNDKDMSYSRKPEAIKLERELEELV